MTTQALYDMKLVDSVMRESQRLNPPFLGEYVHLACDSSTMLTSPQQTHSDDTL